MKHFHLGLTFLSSSLAFAGNYIQNGIFAPHKRICAYKVTFNHETSKLVKTRVKNPHFSERCTHVGDVDIYDKHGPIDIDEKTVNAYFQLCEGASRTWCRAIEVVNSHTFIEYVDTNMTSFYLY